MTARLPLVLAAVACVALASATALATPSTQVWIPSTDIQKFASLHLNYDVYARPAKNTVLVLGPTAGILPFDKLQAEVGFDLMFQGIVPLDEHPLYLHGKLGTSEDALFGGAPAIALGVYNVGIKHNLTDQNVAYGLVSRSLPVLGRLSLGYYLGSGKLLVDQSGRKASRGLLASWDRTLCEVSDKLWLAVDYQAGRSALGALSFGVAWAFSGNTSVIAGYDHYLNEAVAGRDTFTVQLDINIGPPEPAAGAPPPTPPPAP